VDDARIQAVLCAVSRLAAWPAPEELSDGLSAPLSRRCLALCTGLVDEPGLREALRIPGIPPRTAVVVAARGVFAAPLEWVVLLAAAGARVHLKVPQAAPAFGVAIAETFSAEGLAVVASASHLLPDAEAVVAMGSDETIAAVAARYPAARTALHGHRSSFALVSEDADAEALANDVVLYDGRGCFTPTAIFVVGDPSSLARRLGEALEHADTAFPPGAPAHGPEWRRRLGLARARGRLLGGDRWAVAILGPEHAETVALQRFIGVHSVASVEEVTRRLLPWKGRIAACATDLPMARIADLTPLRLERICRPGRLQAPPLGHPHGGVEALRALYFHPSVETGVA